MNTSIFDLSCIIVFTTNGYNISLFITSRPFSHCVNQTLCYYSIIKDNSSVKIFEGVKLEIFSNDSVFRKLIEYYPGRGKRRVSKREYEILGLMQTGLSTKEIAQRLNISQHTARN